MKPKDDKTKSNDLNGDSVRNYSSCWGLNSKKRKSNVSIVSKAKDAKLKSNLNKDFIKKKKKK